MKCNNNKDLKKDMEKKMGKSINNKEDKMLKKKDKTISMVKEMKLMRKKEKKEWEMETTVNKVESTEMKELIMRHLRENKSKRTLDLKIKKKMRKKLWLCKMRITSCLCKRMRMRMMKTMKTLKMKEMQTLEMNKMMKMKRVMTETDLVHKKDWFCSTE